MIESHDGIFQDDDFVFDGDDLLTAYSPMAFSLPDPDEEGLRLSDEEMAERTSVMERRFEEAEDLWTGHELEDWEYRAWQKLQQDKELDESHRAKGRCG